MLTAYEIEAQWQGYEVAIGMQLHC